MRHLLTFSMFIFVAGCSQAPTPQNDAASLHTQEQQQRVLDALPFQDRQDDTDVKRGLIAPATGTVITRGDRELWRVDDFDFVEGKAPTTVNPSLWRQAVLNQQHGLYQVTGPIYQVRGFDLANMTLIVGETGFIIVDPLTSVESAAAALAFARQHLGDKPVSAVIFTHAHIDHFGGVLGVVTEAQLASGNIPVIAPAGFLEEATSENIIAGVAMGRRAGYQYGSALPRSTTGYVGSGLGKGPVMGTFSLAEPSITVQQTGEVHIVDGVEFIFQLTPDTESPSEFTFYLPALKAFCGAELLSRNMHNLYTLRGAKVRDARRWSSYIDEARQLFSDAEVYFASHHWPMWGQANIQTFLTKQRDLYAFIHDQTVRLINKGYNADEIAEQLTLPDSLALYWPNRGYHGALKHNVRAVYQFYMGWYDGNPAHLDPLPEAVSAHRYLSAMGGVEKVMLLAQQVYDEGEYRWAAELLNKVVFAIPDNIEAKQLLAKVYDQLGYQAEAGSWRNSYLSAAMELRQGTPEKGMDLRSFKQVLLRTGVDKFFSSMSVRLSPSDAITNDVSIVVDFTDLQQRFWLRTEHAVLQVTPLKPEVDVQADATLRITRALFVGLIIGETGMRELATSDDIAIDGSIIALGRFLAMFEKPDGRFPIVTPR